MLWVPGINGKQHEADQREGRQRNVRLGWGCRPTELKRWAMAEKQELTTKAKKQREKAATKEAALGVEAFTV